MKLSIKLKTFMNGHGEDCMLKREIQTFKGTQKFLKSFCLPLKV